MPDLAPVPPPNRTFSGVIEFYRGCVEVIGTHFKAIGLIFLALCLPYSIFSWLFLSFMGQRMATITQSFGLSEGLGAAIGVYALATFAAYSLMLGIIATVVASRMASLEVAPRGCVAWALRRLPYVIGYSLVVSAVTALGMVFLVIPGIYLALRLFAVPFVALFEPAQSPLRRSWALTQDRTMEVFLVIAVMMAFLFVVAIVKMLAGVVASSVPFSQLLVTFAAMFPDWVVPIIVSLLLYGWFRQDLVAFEELTKG